MKNENLWNKCIRVRVKILVDKLLLRGLFVNDGMGRKKWVYFRYESLLEFFYWCGYIGHFEKDCSGLDCEREVALWPYDPLWKASPSRIRRMCSGTSFNLFLRSQGLLLLDQILMLGMLSTEVYFWRSM